MRFLEDWGVVIGVVHVHGEGHLGEERWLTAVLGSHHQSQCPHTTAARAGSQALEVDRSCGTDATALRVYAEVALGVAGHETVVNIAVPST